MLIKETFYDDETLNRFFIDNVDAAGKSTFFLVKFIVSFNPFERKREFHIVYSSDGMMKGGEHMRKNGGETR